MPSFKTITAFLALMSVVSASPVDFDKRATGRVKGGNGKGNGTLNANPNGNADGHKVRTALVDLNERATGGIKGSNGKGNGTANANPNGNADGHKFNQRATGGVQGGNDKGNGTANANPNSNAGGKKFSINQVAGKKKVAKNGPNSILGVYQKYNLRPPRDVTSAATANPAGTVKGSVAANPEAWDVQYLSPVTVGQNDMFLDFDTGSADLWVFSTKMPAAQQGGHSLYNASTGTLKSGYTWNIMYGDGSGASGIVYADKVTIGGVTATSQAVEAATSVSSSFQSDPNNDGLVGLSFSTLNTVQPSRQNTFFDTVKSSLVAPLFTASLKKGAPGTYDFGYVDTNKYTGTIAYVPVNTGNGWWQFTSTGYAVGTGATVSTSFDGIADTGTTLMYLPTAIVQAYYSKIPGAAYNSGAGGWMFPCNSVMPNFSIVVAGQLRTVPGSYINWAPFTSTQCFGGMQENTGIGFSIFGDVFLKSQFVVFDSTGPRIGFATPK